ncbi:MAG: hypothetical protein OQL16_00630 [Gammaproteobacteria bacterium]|nr:hypothetical protein [Gammaproteobacteria bacterium]
MEEDEYRATYRQFNQTRCAFEKAILSRRCACDQAHKFCLAEREGVACKAESRSERCQAFLQQARQKALFALKMTQMADALPHAKEIRVQLGCLSGLTELLDNEQPETIDNVDELLGRTEQQYPGFQGLPFEPLIRAIMRIQGRKRRRKNND